jgi:hypothetical protein
MMLDALASLDLLEKKKGIYFTTAFSSEFLSKTSVEYMGHIISHHHHLVESWSRLDVSVLSGKPVRNRLSHEPSDGERESFLMGMFNMAMLMAPMVVPQIDLTGRSHLLDCHPLLYSEPSNEGDDLRPSCHTPVCQTDDIALFDATADRFPIW